MTRQRIPYVDPATMTDPEMVAEMERCAREGCPRPESQAIRAHAPDIMKTFAATWDAAFRGGTLDHAIKELCRIYVSRSVKCEYCGNQRSEKAKSGGTREEDYKDLLMFEKSTRYDARTKAALAYCDAIVWDQPADDALWARLHEHFDSRELVELGYFVALTMGQQRWLRTLNIDHHAILPGTTAAMAPGMEDRDALNRAKSAAGYWARPSRPVAG
ncbi:MAG: carboxymuconolactone decarboxylase family protein [Pseudomonadota bacterium]